MTDSASGSSTESIPSAGTVPILDLVHEATLADISRSSRSLPTTVTGRRILKYLMQTGNVVPSGWTGTINPLLAAYILALGGKNRQLREVNVERYVSQLRLGRWKDTHQGVGLSIEDRLLDAQHRLTAIVRSGISARMQITFDLSPEVMGVIDNGARRTTGEAFDILHGINPKAAPLVTAIRGLEQPEMAAQAIDAVDAFRVYEIHKRGVEWAMKSVPTRSFVGSAQVRGALAFCYPKHPDIIAAFATQVVQGLEVKQGSPAYRLRAALDGKRVSGGFDRWTALFATVISAYSECNPDVVGPKTSLRDEKLFLGARAYFEGAHRARRAKLEAGSK